MANNELLLYRIETAEKEITEIIEASHEMTKTISSLVTQLGAVNENLDRIVELSNKLTERLTILESDLHERTLRKKIYKSLITFYPLIIICMILFMNLDHQKMMEVLAELKLIIPRIS